MYEQLREEYKKPLEDIGFSFDKAYDIAFTKYGNNTELIRSTLQHILETYSKTKSKTKGGKIARYIAKILSIIAPFIKLKR